jgi:hypothetical protein
MPVSLLRRCSGWWRFVLCIALLWTAAPVQALPQALPPPDTVAGPPAVAGYWEGRRLAASHDVSTRAVGSVLGGALIGFFLAPAVVVANPVAAVPIGLGAGVVSAVALLGSVTLPDSLVRQSAQQGPVYAQAFRVAYIDRVKARRRRASLFGAAGGTAVGLGLFFVILSQALSDL